MAFVSRRSCIVGLFTAPVALALSAQTSIVYLDGDFVRVTPPAFHFLSGKVLNRLLDGETVGILGQFSLSTDANATIRARSISRFALSYDLWEEKFSATLVQQTRRSASHLSLDGLQAWIFDNLALNAAEVPPDRNFWMRVDLRVEDPRDAHDIIGGSGINLTRLVEIFSRPASGAEQHWNIDVGPLRLSDLRARRRAG